MADASGEDEVLEFRTFNWPMTLYSLVFFAMAGFFWGIHALGSARGGPLVFAWIHGALGVMALLYSLAPLSLRADATGLEWRQAGPKRSLIWSEIEGFGVWRDRSSDAWNAHPMVQFTRSQQPRSPARLMIRLTPEARKARGTQGRYMTSGYDIALMLPVRMTLTTLTDRLEARLARARARAAG
jgi:hypothetical protein